MGNLESWQRRYEKVKPRLEKKRFHLSSQEFAKERLQAIRDAYSTFSEAHPEEVIDFSLYGSLTKGYAEPDSDVDGIFFVNEDKVKDAVWGQENAEVLQLFKKELTGKLTIDIKLQIYTHPLSWEGADEALR